MPPASEIGMPGAGAKVPSPAPSSTVSVLSWAFVTTRSSNEFTAELNLPTAMASGRPPTGTGLPVASVKVPSPLPSKICTEFPALSATARSALAIAVEVAMRLSHGTGLEEIVGPSLKTGVVTAVGKYVGSLATGVAVPSFAATRTPPSCLVTIAISMAGLPVLGPAE